MERYEFCDTLIYIYTPLKFSYNHHSPPFYFQRRKWPLSRKLFNQTCTKNL